MPAFVVQKGEDGNDYILADPESKQPYRVSEEEHSGYENTLYKVNEITSASTKRQYPSAKATYEALDKKLNKQFPTTYSGKFLRIAPDGSVLPNGVTATDVVNLDTFIKDWIQNNKELVKQMLDIT